MIKRTEVYTKIILLQKVTSQWHTVFGIIPQIQIAAFIPSNRAIVKFSKTFSHFLVSSFLLRTFHENAHKK